MKIQTKEEAKNLALKDHNIIVLPMRLSDNSKCGVCKEADDKYALFSGGTKFSDLNNTTCGDCLPNEIDRLAIKRAESIKKAFTEIENHFK